VRPNIVPVFKSGPTVEWTSVGWHALCEDVGKSTFHRQTVPNPISESTAMKHKRHFEIDRTSATVREAATIGAMIADMLRAVELLENSVSAEEERSPFRDRADGRYPILARQFAARRDNLKVTIAALKARLSSNDVHEAKFASAA
jgi:hypothetical protein